MEFFIWGIVISAGLLGLFLPGDFMEVYLYLLCVFAAFLWLRLIYHNRTKPRLLWRYLVEWAIILILYISPFSWLPAAVQTIWWFANLPFFAVWTLLPSEWVYPIVCLTMIGSCGFCLIRNHKINKEWW